jgi:hypothetical protein
VLLHTPGDPAAMRAAVARLAAAPRCARRAAPGRAEPCWGAPGSRCAVSSSSTTPWPYASAGFETAAPLPPPPPPPPEAGSHMRIVQLANFHSPVSGGLRTSVAAVGRGYAAAGHTPSVDHPRSGGGAYGGP